MKCVIAAATALLAVVLAPPRAGALQPYVQFEAGIIARDVVEEDASITGFSAEGRASSTRLLATAGLDFNDFLTVYAQGGAADLAIDGFNGFDSSSEGAYGGGVRLNLFTSPYRNRLRLFVDASVLHTEAADTVQAEFRCNAANGCSGAAPGGRPVYYPRAVSESIEWTEYAVLLGADARYGTFGLQGGVRLSKVDATDRIRAAPDANFATAFQLDAEIREQDNFGLFFGTDFYLDAAGRTSLGLGVSLFDQDSFRAWIRRAF